MIPQTKGDLVIAALRKAAIASDTTLTDIEPESLRDGLSDLELMMYEWAGPDNTIYTGYNFALLDQNGDVAQEDPHGLAGWMLNGVINSLAVRMLPDYKTAASQELVTKANYGKQQIINMTKARQRKSHYRSRTPVGSGNRWANSNGFRYFHRHCDNPDEDEI